MAKKENQDEVVEDVIEDDETTDETVVEEDSDGTEGMESKHKTAVLSVAMHKLGSMSKPEVELFLKSMDTIGKEADPIPGGAAGKNAASLKMHPSHASAEMPSIAAARALKESVKEDLAAVFGDNKELSEEFKENMATLFEAAVSARLVLVESEMQEAYEAAFNEEMEAVTEDLLGKIDEYLDYVCEEWMSENEVAIQSTLTTEITEGFMHGLKDLFKEHYIEVPEDKVDVVEMLSLKVEELEASLNEQMTENMRLAETAKEFSKAEVIDQVAEGLTPIQAAKFAQLTEDLDYDGNNDEFAKKLNVIKEAHFVKKTAKKTSGSSLITEEIAHDPNEDTSVPRVASPEMKPYVAALNRTIRAR